MIQILGSISSGLVGLGRTSYIIVMMIISYNTHSILSQMVGPVEWKVSRLVVTSQTRALF